MDEPSNLNWSFEFDRKGRVSANAVPSLSLVDIHLDPLNTSDRDFIELRLFLAAGLYEEWIHGGNAKLGFNRLIHLLERKSGNSINHFIARPWYQRHLSSSTRHLEELKGRYIAHFLAIKRIYEQVHEIIETADKFIFQKLAEDHNFLEEVANQLSAIDSANGAPRDISKDEIEQAAEYINLSRQTIPNEYLFDRLTNLYFESDSLILVKTVVDKALDVPDTVDDIIQGDNQPYEVDVPDFESRLLSLLDAFEQDTASRGADEIPVVADCRVFEEDIQLESSEPESHVLSPPDLLESRVHWYTGHHLANRADVSTPLSTPDQDTNQQRNLPLIDIPAGIQDFSLTTKLPYPESQMQDPSESPRSPFQLKFTLEDHLGDDWDIVTYFGGFGLGKLFENYGAFSGTYDGNRLLVINPEIASEGTPYRGLSYAAYWKRKFVKQQLLQELVRADVLDQSLNLSCPLCSGYDVVHPKSSAIEHNRYHRLVEGAKSHFSTIGEITIPGEDEITKYLS